MPSKSMVKSSSRTSESVMVFIDGSNLYHVLDQNCSKHNVHFDKFANKLANGRNLKRTYYYNIRQEIDKTTQSNDQKKFLDSMFDTPYLEVKLGISKQRGETVVEKGVDVMLATDLVVHAYKNHYDTAIVVSGDADFYPALQAVKDIGKHVEVAAFESNISSESSRVSDVHIRLTKSYFTGLWMPKLSVTLKKEVSDEAASPNGEDKSRTRTKVSRKKIPSVPSNSSKNKKRSNGHHSTQSIRQAKSTKNDGNDTSGTYGSMRSTPSRRKVGGSGDTGNNGLSGRRKSPPTLRTDLEGNDDNAMGEKKGWLKKLGM